MTVLEALTILEAAVLECKKLDINTPEVRARWIYWSGIFGRSG